MVQFLKVPVDGSEKNFENKQFMEELFNFKNSFNCH